MNLLICGDTETSAALRHEVPLSIGDPFMYLEADGRRVVVTSALEDARIAEAAPDLERLLIDALSRTGNEPLVAGDVIAVEPGTVVRAVGGVRMEDLLVVTGQGFESLTGTFTHDLAP